MALLTTRSGALRLGPFLGVSAAVHIVVIGVAVGMGAWGRPAINLDDQTVKTRLVKLGKKRDEKLMPRIDRKKPRPKEKAPAIKKPEPKPPEAKKPEPTRPEPKAPDPPPEPKRSARDILKDFADDHPTPRPNLTDLVKDTIEEGDEKGTEIGEEIVGRLKATYNDKLLAAIKRALQVPNTVSDAERLRLKAVLYISVGSGGGLVSARITRDSENPAFDNAVLAAAKNAAPFPSPPIQVRDFYRTGVQMNVCPVSCR